MQKNTFSVANLISSIPNQHKILPDWT